MAKFDPTAAAAKAKLEREKRVTEVAGAKILEISEAADRAIKKGDVAGLTKALGGHTDGKSATTDGKPPTKKADDKARTPRRTRSAHKGGPTTKTSTLGSKLRGRGK